MNLPYRIAKYTDNLKFIKDSVGRSEDEVYLFEKKYVLKISKNSQRLQQEKEKIDWVSKYISSPVSMEYVEEDGLFYYLRTYIDGVGLIDDKFLNNPKLLIQVLTKISKILRSLDDKACPFQSNDNKGNSFVHGDLCLPNILVDKNNELACFIDLDNSGRGDMWYDYAWLLWSFEYNLKTDKYNKPLLDALGLEFDKAKYEKYIDKEYRELLKEKE